jgi:hypothetical protein
VDLVARRWARLDWLIERRGGQCEVCGYGFIGINGHHFDWHHRDPATKAFEIATGMTRSLDQLEIEVDKCDLLCKLCHADRHFTRPMNKIVPRINFLHLT